MNAMNEIFVYLIQTLVSIYLLIMLMRFVLQLTLADFYNPLSQFLVRATNPLVLPLRRIVPARGRLDLASLLWAVIIQLLGIVVLLWVNGISLPAPTLLVAWSVVAVVGLLIKIYFFALLGMIILSWVAPGTSNPAALLMYQIVQPIMEPVRRMLPSMGGLDFSPIVVFILINIATISLRNFAAGLGLHPALVMGI